MAALERHNPNQWGYAGMTTAMKRDAHHDDDDDGGERNHSSPFPKLSKISNFVPPAFQPREPAQPMMHSKPPVSPPFEPPKPSSLFNDNLIQRLVGNTHTPIV